MKNSLAIAFTMVFALAFADLGIAGGKPDGSRCHVSKSCSSGVCARLQPQDKFGVCCVPQECPALNAQCGTIDNGCGVPIFCGPCGQGSDCIDNQCVPDTTTTTTTSTTTSTTTTSTTSTTTSTTTTSTTSTTTTSTTTTTTTTVTSTTLGFLKSCAGYCSEEPDRVVPPGDGPDCYCDGAVCFNNDGCPDFDPQCDSGNPLYVCD